MPTSTAPCAVCAGPPIRRVVWLHTLSFADTRRRQAWYAQPCTACGLALGVHQTYRHPHPARRGKVYCVGFCGAETDGR